MNRIAVTALLGLFLTACASAPPNVAQVATVRPAEFSEELECMAECLEDRDCGLCADTCLRAESPLTVVTSGM